MPDANVDVLLNEPIGRIHPNIYGHFAEHLGTCIYEGICVEPDSPIPNTAGIRQDVVEALKAVRPPALRWPGGCFADDYHWRDGIGPRESRPRRINIHWGDVIEPNTFGTHEFVSFCRAIGAEPYFCGNLGSGTPQEMRDWVEYCNFPGDSALAQERAANGADAPFDVRYWGVGNENWGCGGNFTPEDYATEYRRFATYLRNWGKTPLHLIACGPNGNDLDWTRRFFTKLRRDYGRGPALHAYAAHYYCGTAGTATEYTEAQWYELLWKAIQMEPLVVQQRALMDAFDPERKVGLIVDEWGTWHPPTPGRNPAFLWQQNTLRDALVAALTLDIFNRHADKVVMANIAQTINVLQALLLTDGEKVLKTPTYHVYDLYQPHQDGQAVRTLWDAPEKAAAVGATTQRLSVAAGSASIKGDLLTLTVVNASATESVELRARLLGGAKPIRVRAAAIRSEEGDIRAHNTFETTDRIGVAEIPVPPVSEESLFCSLPPASVTRLTCVLG